MKIRTPEFKTQLKTLGRELDTKVTYGTNELTSEELNYIKPRFNTELFKTVMKVIEFDSSVKLESKQWINAKIGVRVGEEYELLDFGICYINNEPEFNVDFSSFTHKAYDKMIESMILYDTNPLEITYPITYKNLLIAICDKLGWTYELPLTFPNMDKNIIYDLYKDLGLTYRDILDDLCPLSMGNFINDGKFKIIYPTETNDTIDDEFLKEDNITIGKKIGPINSLVLSRAEDGDTIDRTDSQSITENGLNEIKIKDNIILSSEFRENFIDEMFEKIKGFEYYSIDIATTGVLYYEPLDRFTINHNGVNYSTIALNSEIELEDGLSEIIFAPELEESTTDYETSSQTDKAKKMASIIAYKNQAKIDLLTEEQTEQGNKIGSLEISVNEINGQVGAFYNFAKTITGVYKIKLEDAVPTNILRFSAKVKTTNYLLPSDTLFPSDTLLPRSEDITLVIDNLEEQKEVIIDIDKPLYYLGNVHDEVVIEFNEETALCTIKLIRRIQNIGGILSVRDTPIEQILDEQKIALFKGTNYIYLKEYIDWELEATYISNNELNKYFASKVETLTQILLSEENIKLKVETKADKQHLISQINLSPEEIKLKANKIALEGTVTANENFKILEDGSIRARNGSFSGNIFLEDGGRVLGGDGILTNLQFNSVGVFANYTMLGYNMRMQYVGESYVEVYPYADVTIDVHIPENFTIMAAYLILNHTPAFWLDNERGEYWGGAKNLKLFKVYSDTNYVFNMAYLSDFSNIYDLDSSSLVEIPNAFGSSSYTPTNQSSNTIETKKTMDIKDYITSSGNHKFVVRTTAPMPNSQHDAGLKTGMGKASVIIYGFTKGE